MIDMLTDVFEVDGWEIRARWLEGATQIHLEFVDGKHVADITIPDFASDRQRIEWTPAAMRAEVEEWLAGPGAEVVAQLIEGPTY